MGAMCRIYGHFNAIASRAELAAVAALQRHGGPDASGIRCGQTWSLGSNRLAIMDPAGGRQPYQLRDGAITVVFNGEIYNHAELRERLCRHGYAFADHCDGSILPALYQRYGDRFTDHLDGMYAIAIMDLRAEPRLVLATDHLGMKPIYYSWHPERGELFFSSELPSLLAFEAVSRARRPAVLDAYLATKTPFGEQTMFADVAVLPPATTAVCDRLAGLRFPRTRTPPAPLEGELGLALAAEDPGGDLRVLLRREVRALLAADVPVATITSGGLDSSLVTVFAGKPHTFNIGYTGTWPDDERHYARQVAGQCGAVYHQVELDPATFPDLLPQVIWHLGQPNADPITVSTYALFAAVHAAGFKVALTGDAADEVFGGYARMRTAARADAAGQPWLPGYLDSLAAIPASLRKRVYTPEFAAEVATWPAIPAQAIHALSHGAGSVLDRITAFELGFRLPAYHLRRVDHLSMAHSVEVRLPYCQRRVYDLGRRLPDEQRVDETGVKVSLYRAAAGLLPERVLTRPKQPFTLPVCAMLAPGWPLWEYAQDMLAAGRLRRAGEIEPRQVGALFAAQAERPDDTSALALWALLIYQIWLEHYEQAGWATSEKPLAGGYRSL
jgi:asparagine synthase (glutamine-hydrolysing)